MRPNVYDVFNWKMMSLSRNVVSDLYGNINTSFNFGRTQEGSDFWLDLQQRLSDYYNQRLANIQPNHNKVVQQLPADRAVINARRDSCINSASQLIDAFAWYYTVEGWDWWYNVYIRLLFQAYAIRVPLLFPVPVTEVHRLAHREASFQELLAHDSRNPCEQIIAQRVRVIALMRQALGDAP